MAHSNGIRERLDVWRSGSRKARIKMSDSTALCFSTFNLITLTQVDQGAATFGVDCGDPIDGAADPGEVAAVDAARPQKRAGLHAQ